MPSAASSDGPTATQSLNTKELNVWINTDDDPTTSSGSFLKFPVLQDDDPFVLHMMELRRIAAEQGAAMSSGKEGGTENFGGASSTTSLPPGIANMSLAEAAHRGAAKDPLPSNDPSASGAAPPPAIGSASASMNVASSGFLAASSTSGPTARQQLMLQGGISFDEWEQGERNEIILWHSQWFITTTLAFVHKTPCHKVSMTVDKAVSFARIIMRKSKFLIENHFHTLFPYGVAGTVLEKDPTLVDVLAATVESINTVCLDESGEYIQISGLAGVKLTKDTVPRELHAHFFGLMAAKQAFIASRCTTEDLRLAVVNGVYGITDDAQECREPDLVLCKQILLATMSRSCQKILLPILQANVAPDIGPLYPCALETEQVFSSTFEDPDNTINVEYQRGECCGKGSYGKVYRCIDVTDGKFLALKVLPLPSGVGRIAAEKEQKIRSEVDIFRRLNHKNIIRYYGCCFDRDTCECRILMEYAPKSLLQVVQEHKGLTPQLIAHYARKILKGMEFMHAARVVHRDIKAANILVSEMGEVKLSDFGEAALQEEAEEDSPTTNGTSTAGDGKPDTNQSSVESLLSPRTNSSQRTESTASNRALKARAKLVGTPLFMAPELLRGALPDEGSDIWAFGCMLIEMATGKPPWQELVQQKLPMPQLLFKLSNITEPPTVPEDLCGKDFASFAALALRLDPSSRPSAKQMLMHPFLANTADMEKSGRGMRRPKGTGREVGSRHSIDNEETAVEDDKKSHPSQVASMKYGATGIESKRNQVSKRQYSRLKLLGKGSFGSVYSVVFEDGSMGAMKLIDLSGDSGGEDGSTRTMVMKGVDILASLEHPHIVQYYGHHEKKDGDPPHITTGEEGDPSSYIEIVMEYVPAGTLSQIGSFQLKSSKDPSANERMIKKYIGQVLRALHYLHSKGIVHRDVKSENVLLSHDGGCKLSDFDAAIGNVHKEYGAQTMVGTPYFMAPEIIRPAFEEAMAEHQAETDASSTGELVQQSSRAIVAEANSQSYGSKVDIWSVGIMALELLGGGEMPWPAFGNTMELFQYIIDPTKKPVIPSGASADMTAFVEQCCQHDPTKRPDAETLLSHAWLQASASTSGKEPAAAAENEVLGAMLLSEGGTATTTM